MQARRLLLKTRSQGRVAVLDEAGLTSRRSDNTSTFSLASCKQSIVHRGGLPNHGDLAHSRSPKTPYPLVSPWVDVRKAHIGQVATRRGEAEGAEEEEPPLSRPGGLQMLHTMIPASLL
jgi:hypothetical protein